MVHLIPASLVNKQFAGWIFVLFAGVSQDLGHFKVYGIAAVKLSYQSTEDERVESYKWAVKEWVNRCKGVSRGK